MIINNPLGDFGDKAFEQLEDVKNTAVREVKSLPKAVKSQVAGPSDNQMSIATGNEVRDKKQDPSGKKMDPVTGKPVPSKKLLTQITTATAQVAMSRLKSLREELAKQRLKTEAVQEGKAKEGEAGPEIKKEEPKPKEDAISKMLKASKSTGEAKGLIGG